MVTEYITEEKVLELLADAVEQAGSQYAWAEKAGVTHAYVSMVLRKKRRIGLPMLVALGVGREITVKYVKINDSIS